MDFKNICKSEEYADISGDINELMRKHRWNSLVMPAGSGKTTLLSMLYYFFDVNEDSYALFHHSKAASEWSEWKEFLNKRIVITLDFSDFDADNMCIALEYIKEKMLALYKEKLHLVLDSGINYIITSYMETLLSIDKYQPLKIQEHMVTDQQKNSGSDCRIALESSLRRLLDTFYHGEYSKKNAVLLIDNMCRLEKISEEKQYGSEMYHFLTEFLDFEPDKKCCLYLQVSDDDSPDETNSHRHYFCCDPPFMPHTHLMKWRSDSPVIYPEELYHAEIREKNLNTDPELKTLILQGKIIMLERQKQDLENTRNRRINQMIRYREPLDPEIPMYSRNMGLRHLKRLPRNDNYYALNAYIKKLYKKCEDTDDYKKIYRILQNVNPDKQTDWNHEAYSQFEAECANLREGWKIKRYSSDYYWDQIYVRTPSGNDSFSKIKVSITTSDNAVKDLFTGAAKTLIKDGNDGFTAKISKIERDGTMVFFLSRRDFFLLENYMKDHSDQLKKGNPFFAHRGFLGISRDLVDLNSHNGQHAKMLRDYFGIIRNEDDIDLEEMYRLFVMGWNGELSEDHIFFKDFSECSAQTFVLIMDSLDAILGEGILNDEHLLLNDNRKIWSLLENSRCWGDMGRSR